MRDNANDVEKTRTKTIQLGVLLLQPSSVKPTIRLIPQVITLDQFAPARGLERLQESEVSGVPAAAEDREASSLQPGGSGAAARGACTI